MYKGEAFFRDVPKRHFQMKLVEWMLGSSSEQIKALALTAGASYCVISALSELDLVRRSLKHNAVIQERRAKG